MNCFLSSQRALTQPRSIHASSAEQSQYCGCFFIFIERNMKLSAIQISSSTLHSMPVMCESNQSVGCESAIWACNWVSTTLLEANLMQGRIHPVRVKRSTSFTNKVQNFCRPSMCALISDFLSLVQCFYKLLLGSLSTTLTLNNRRILFSPDGRSVQDQKNKDWWAMCPFSTAEQVSHEFTGSHRSFSI